MQSRKSIRYAGKAKLVLTILSGWKCDIRGVKNYEEFLVNCRKYIEFIEEQIGYPMTVVSNGPARGDIVVILYIEKVP